MTTTLTLPHRCTAENAQRFWDWLTTRGGLAIWGSVNLSNPGRTWTAPHLDPQGLPKDKPNWQCGSSPIRIITDPSEVLVSMDAEVKRFHVAIRRGSQGLTMKLTDASTIKVRKAEEKAGEGAYHLFDYESQEAVIMAPVSEQTLKCWAHEKGLI
jgi:hypothetical protein